MVNIFPTNDADVRGTENPTHVTSCFLINVVREEGGGGVPLHWCETHCSENGFSQNKIDTG